MPRKTLISRYQKSARLPVNGKVIELTDHGYGKISISGTGETVHFRLSQVRAPRGHVISKAAKMGNNLIGMPVKVRARNVGGGKLLASSVVVGVDSGNLQKRTIGVVIRGARMSKPASIATSGHAVKLNK